MEKWLQRKCFPVNIEKRFRTPILKSICEWLLLEMPLWWSEKACNFIESLAQVFSCEHCEIFQNTYFKEHLEQLLLKIFPAYGQEDLQLY